MAGQYLNRSTNLAKGMGSKGATPMAGKKSPAELAGASFDKGSAMLKPKGDAKSAKKDKPFEVAGSGERKVFTPKKDANGKTLYFFYGYTGSKKDQKMRDSETADIEDDVLYAAAAGFKVVYDKAGTREDFFNAIYDSTCTGIYWSGHGYMNGNVQTSDGRTVRPEDVDTSRRSPNIKYLILAACGSGKGQERWKSVLGEQCEFEGWVEITTTSETRDFTSGGLLDSWASHKGINPDKEMRDYVQQAQK